MTIRSAGRVAGRVATGTAPFAAAGIAAFATFARQDGIPKARTVWAEDGPIFSACAYFNPSPLRCIVEPYQGSLFVVPRLGALVAAAVPPASLSLALTAVASLVVAICALAVARAISRATGSAASGLMGGAALALVHEAGVEVGGNLTNLHWILLAAAVVIVVSAWLARRASVLDIAIVVLAVLSSAFAPFLAILVAVAWLGVARGRILLVLTTLATLVQVATSLAFPRPASRTPLPSLAVIARGYETEVVVRGAFGGLAAPPDWIVAAGIGWVLLLLLADEASSRRPLEETSPPAPSPSTSPSRGIAAIFALVGTGVAVFGASLFVNRWLNPRYGYVPSVLGVEALVIAAAWLRRARSRTMHRGLLRVLACATLPVAVALLALGFVRSFSVRARASNGPDYVAAYETEHEKCATGARLIEITISPGIRSSPWRVRVPCSRVAGR